MRLRQEAVDRKAQIAVYGLGIVAFVAGITKFIDPGLWAAYEPVFVSQISPIGEVQRMYISGAFELSIGVMLFLRKKVSQVAAIFALWLSGITLAMIKMGLWTIALRDFGLVVLAVLVSLEFSDA